MREDGGQPIAPRKEHFLLNGIHKSEGVFFNMCVIVRECSLILSVQDHLTLLSI